jgi:hypothetical protein
MKSALPPKADIRGYECNVRFVPIADIAWIADEMLIRECPALPHGRCAAGRVGGHTTASALRSATVAMTLNVILSEARAVTQAAAR